MRNRNRQRAVVLGLVALGVTLAGCEEFVVDSRWRDRDILIDGDLVEWYNATTCFQSEKVSLGAFNDGSHLYVSLSTVDRRTQHQVLGRGFVLWFDPEGGEDKTFGIQFPLGMMERGARPQGGPGSFPELEELVQQARSSDAEMEIVFGESRQRIPIHEDSGIQVAVAPSAHRPGRPWRSSWKLRS